MENFRKRERETHKIINELKNFNYSVRIYHVICFSERLKIVEKYKLLFREDQSFW